MKILLADDDSKIHVIVHLWLRRNGHDVTAARDGREALAKLDEQPFDVLISDVNMPLMNGVELVKTVLERENGPPLIIMMTSRCDSCALAKEIDSRRVQVLNKPFSPRQLAQLIEEAPVQQIT